MYNSAEFKFNRKNNSLKHLPKATPDTLPQTTRGEEPPSRTFHTTRASRAPVIGDNHDSRVHTKSQLEPVLSFLLGPSKSTQDQHDR